MSRVIAKFCCLAFIVFLSPAAGFAERLGVCGIEGLRGACESKYLQSFRVAAKVIDDALVTCGQMNAMFPGECTDDEWVGDLAQDIGNGLKRNSEVVKIEFKSERENPGFFLLDGQVRIAKTGTNRGDVIYVNSDMAEANKVEITEATAVLSHELGHHFGVTDHQKLDKFGASIKEYVTKFQISASELLPGASGVDQVADLSVFNLWNLINGLPYAPVDGSTTVFLWDGFDYIDLTTGLMPKLCESGWKVTSFSMRAVTLAGVGDQTLVVKSPLSYVCMPVTTGAGHMHADMNAYGSLPTKKIGDHVIIDADRINWDIKKCTEDTDLGCRP